MKHVFLGTGGEESDFQAWRSRYSLGRRSQSLASNTWRDDPHSGHRGTHSAKCQCCKLLDYGRDLENLKWI